MNTTETKTETPFRGEHYGVFCSDGNGWYVAGVDSSGTHRQQRGTMEIGEANKQARQMEQTYTAALARGPITDQDGRTWSAAEIADEEVSTMPFGDNED